MLRLLSTIISRPVIAQREGAAVAAVTEAVCDPAKAKVIAYRVDTAPGFVATSDILTYLDDGLTVSDRDAIQAEDDLIRVKRLGEQRTAVLGLKVVTEQRKRLGTVSDALIETDGHFLSRLHVRPRFPSSLFGSERIIPRERVVRMDSREVVVRYDGEARPVGAEPEIAQ